MARTAVALAALSAASSVLGLVRDLTLAGLFGASSATDAFLVAWTVPETATPLLMEGALAYVLVPAFARELQQRGSLTQVVRRTWLPLVVLLGTASALLALFAPLVVSVVTPGLAEPALAARCLRAAAPTLTLLGVSGYLMAGLRVRGSFRLPASIYIAYNLGILSSLYALHSRLGVLSGAVGLTVGASLMVLVQLPAFLRGVGRTRPAFDLRALAIFVPFVPIAGYTLGRQAQVFVERILGSSLHSGSISQLNYASKIAQVPMALSLTVATVTFPALARTASSGQLTALAAAIRRDLRVVAQLIVPATVAIVVLAPQLVAVMFERGRFGAADTSATAAVMRVYATGLLGQSVASVAALAAFSAGRVNWGPARAAAAGLVVTIVVDLVAAPVFGVSGLAAGNALGISVLALVMVRRVATSVPPLQLDDVVRDLVRCLAAGAVSLTLGVAALRLMPPHATLAQLTVVGSVIAVSYFVAAAVLLPSGEAASMLSSVIERLSARVGAVPWSVMYHAVSDPSDDPLVVCISPERLDRQLSWLRRRGLRGVGLQEYHRAVVAGAGHGLVGLSFDDGYQDFLTEAVPLLERYGFGATVFVLSDRVGGTNDWDEGPVRRLLDADEVRAVAARGFEVGSHGATHVDLRGLGPAELEAEVRGSKESLERLLEQPVVGFCYPYGYVNEAAVQAARSAGYDYAAAVGWQDGVGPFTLPRVFVGEQDGAVRLTAKRLLFWWHGRRGMQA